jgi:hypothetical protein
MSLPPHEPASTLSRSNLLLQGSVTPAMIQASLSRRREPADTKAWRPSQEQVANRRVGSSEDDGSAVALDTDFLCVPVTHLRPPIFTSPNSTLGRHDSCLLDNHNRRLNRHTIHNRHARPRKDRVERIHRSRTVLAIKQHQILDRLFPLPQHIDHVLC